MLSEKIFSKIIGNKMTTPIKENEITSKTVNDVIRSVDLNGKILNIALTEHNGYKFYLIYGNNSQFFDFINGEESCLNLIVEHIESGTSWITNATPYMSSKHAKNTLRRLRDNATKTSIDEIEKTRTLAQTDIPMHYFTK